MTAKTETDPRLDPRIKAFFEAFQARNPLARPAFPQRWESVTRSRHSRPSVPTLPATRRVTSPTSRISDPRHR